MKTISVKSACYATGVPHLVDVAVTLRPGLPVFSIIGLPDRLVREARERVKAAFASSGLPFPRGRVTVSLSPPSIPKAGTQLDLAIAAALLKVSGLAVDGDFFLGELEVGGDAVLRAEHLGLTGLGNAVCGYSPYLVDGKVVGSLRGLVKGEFLKVGAPDFTRDKAEYAIDSIEGLQSVKRALLVAMAGRHKVLLSGAAGTGKTMLAKALAELMPAFTLEDWQKAAAWRGRFGLGAGLQRPLFTPAVAVTNRELFGRPGDGQVGSLASAVSGMAFLDEISLYRGDVLSMLRMPLEEGRVSITTAHGDVSYPLPSVMWAATNTCPCGNYGVVGKKCSCNPGQISRFRAMLSTPLLERFQVHLDVPAEVIIGQAASDGKKFAEIIVRVWRNPSSVDWSGEAKKRLEQAANRFTLSPRVQKAIREVAETIAQVDELEEVGVEQLMEALQYRMRQPGTALT